MFQITKKEFVSGLSEVVSAQIVCAWKDRHPLDEVLDKIAHLKLSDIKYRDESLVGGRIVIRSTSGRIYWSDGSILELNKGKFQRLPTDAGIVYLAEYPEVITGYIVSVTGK